MIRPILRYPDPCLTTPAAAVTAFDAGLAALSEDLLETMEAAPGIGITAPHVGVAVRLTVIRVDLAAPALVLANPAVAWASPETQRHVEGSVSMPGLAEDVERPARVRVAYQDLHGIGREIEADGLLAVTLQHEIDQLDGIFWIQRLSRLKRDRLLKRWSKALRAGAAG